MRDAGTEGREGRGHSGSTVLRTDACQETRATHLIRGGRPFFGRGQPTTCRPRWKRPARRFSTPSRRRLIMAALRAALEVDAGMQPVDLAEHVMRNRVAREALSGRPPYADDRSVA